MGVARFEVRASRHRGGDRGGLVRSPARRSRWSSSGASRSSAPGRASSSASSTGRGRARWRWRCCRA